MGQECVAVVGTGGTNRTNRKSANTLSDFCKLEEEDKYKRFDKTCEVRKDLGRLSGKSGEWRRLRGRDGNEME